MESPRLRVLMLGSPVITWDDKPLKISRRVPRILLLYLASQTTPVSRSSLCQLFWPQLDDTHAQKNLRETLSRLKAELPDPSLIIAKNNEIFLDSQITYVDGREFIVLIDPLVTTTQFQVGSKMPDWMYLQMRAALDLCRGNQILPGYAFSESTGLENWLMLTNQGFEYYLLRGMERLAGHCIAVGNLDEAIKWLGKLAEIDPVNTENNYLILTCLKERGRIKDALDYTIYLERVYQAVTEESLPKTISDFRIRLGEIKYQVPKKEIVDWPGGETNPYPFIGRANLLARLQHAYNRKGIVSIKGESGSGKSRLVQEFYAALPIRPRLLFCSGKPMVRCSPFQPLIEGLRETVTPKEWASLSNSDCQNLRALFPELRDKVDEELASIEEFEPDEGDIVSIFNCLHAILVKLSEKRPLLMVIDIVQWCDDATIDFLSYLSDRDFFKKYGLLIITSRKEEVNDVVEIFIDRNTMLNTLEQIEVPIFTYDETRQMVQGILGKEGDPPFLEKIYRETGGNPFFIIEGLNAIRDIKFDVNSFDDEDLYPIPSTIRALVNEKVRLLSESARRVLQAASVLGQKFQPKVVEEMKEVPPEDLTAAFEELQKFSILTAEHGLIADSRYEFPHDQVREVVLQEMSPMRKRQFHLKAVNALIAVNGNKPDLASIYAYHYTQAGELAKACESWIKAGQFARSRYSKTDTYDAYQRAFDLIPSLPQDMTPPMVLQLTIEWGDYAYDISDLATCEKIYNLCYQLGEQMQDPLLLGAGLSGQGRVCSMKLKIEEGIELIKRANLFLEKAGNVGERLEAYARLGILYNLKNDFILARKALEDGLSVFKEPTSQREMDAYVNIQTQLGLIYILIGYPDKAIELANQSRYFGQLVKRRSAQVQAETILATGLHYAGNFKSSLEHAMVVVNLAEKLNLRWWHSFLEEIIAKNHLVLGNMDDVWVTVRAVIEREKTIKYSQLLKGAYSIQGDIYRFFGNFEKAGEIYKLGIEENVNDFQTLENIYLLGLTRYQMGDHASGKNLVDRAQLLADEKNLGLVALRTAMVEFMVNPGLLGEAYNRSRLDAIIEEFNDRGMKVSSATARFIRGRGLQMIGADDSAKKEYQFVIDFSIQSSNIWLELSARKGIQSLYSPESKEYIEVKKEINRIFTLIRGQSNLPITHKLCLAYLRKNK